jgi:hypothetical protein
VNSTQVSSSRPGGLRSSFTEGEFLVFLDHSAGNASDQLCQNLTVDRFSLQGQGSRGGSSRASENTFIEEELQEGLEAQEGSDTGSLHGREGRRHTVTDPESQEEPTMRSPYAAPAFQSEQESTFERIPERSPAILRKRSGGLDWSMAIKKVPSLHRMMKKGRKGNQDPPEGSSRSD